MPPIDPSWAHFVLNLSKNHYFSPYDRFQTYTINEGSQNMNLNDKSFLYLSQNFY